MYIEGVKEREREVFLAQFEVLIKYGQRAGKEVGTCRHCNFLIGRLNL